MFSKNLFVSSFVVGVLMSVLLIAAVQASSDLWSKNFGGPEDEMLHSLVETSDGGYALAGTTYSFDDVEGESDFWLVKTDADGNVQWNRTYGGQKSDVAYAVIETSDGGYALAGSIDELGAVSFGLVKTDASGAIEWSQTSGSLGYGYAKALIETSDGGYALAGYRSVYATGSYDFVLVKTDSYGNEEWNKTYGGSNYDIVSDLIESSDGGYVLAGSIDAYFDDENFWLVKTDADGNMMWNQTYGGENYDRCSTVVETSDGGYALAGSTFSLSGDDSDFWLIKTDSNGDVEWSHTYGGTENDMANSMVLTSDEGFALFGTTGSYGDADEDSLLIKTDTDGNMQWNQTYGESGNEVGTALVETNDGRFVLGGYTTSFGDGDSDFWLVKTDEKGDIPEFPSYTLLPLFLTLTLAAIIYTKKLAKNDYVKMRR